MSFKNPFSLDRAEHFGNELYKYYSKINSEQAKLSEKSLIVEGGRGSGKTMFLLYNSFFHRKLKHVTSGKTFNEFIDNTKHICVYFRADSDYVTAFYYKDIDEIKWQLLFGHYFNIIITKEFCKIFIDIKQNISINAEIEKNIGIKICTLFDCQTVYTFEDLLELLELEELKLIRYINNPLKCKEPILISNAYLFNLFINEIIKEPYFSKKKFHVFVDEYENLILYQQKLLNTIIKHPNPVVLNVGTRKNGIRTYGTLAECEVINAPHDFTRFEIEEISNKDYSNLLFDICKKRLRNVQELSSEPEDSELFNIEYYIGNYSFDDELKIYENKFKPISIEELKEKYKNTIYYPNINSYYEMLFTDNPIIESRLNRVLIDRDVPIDKLYVEYENYKTGNKSSVYSDWLHNNKNGIMFLLGKEYKEKKMYFGFDAFMFLSSGIIRYFLEFCEISFNHAKRNGFNFSKLGLRKITINEQTTAVRYVSEYKISDIDTYTPFGCQLKSFVINLGNIFKELHKDYLQSEPERNHFTTNSDELNDRVSSFIESAVMWSVLQPRIDTKKKQEDPSNAKITEYHLNKVYAPYFNISYRKIRKLDINADDLCNLIEGNSDVQKKVIDELCKTKKRDDGQLSIF